MNINNKTAIAGGIITALAIGLGVWTSFNALQANAETVTPSTTQQAQALQNRDNFDPKQGGHVGQNGVREELLTGDGAEKVKTAALAAVTGGTIDRVETDAEGSPYEAHMTKSDGSRVTVKLDSSFKVTNIETGAH